MELPYFGGLTRSPEVAVIIVSSGCGQKPHIRGSPDGPDLPPGTRWQCVELFNRFFARQFGIDPVAGDAKHLFIRAGEISGLEPRPNGGEHPPVPGDALVFGGTRTGHVAIITKVTSGRVHVVEQNAPGDGTNSHAYDPITQTVSGAPATVLGWIHAT